MAYRRFVILVIVVFSFLSTFSILGYLYLYKKLDTQQGRVDKLTVVVQDSSQLMKDNKYDRSLLRQRDSLIHLLEVRDIKESYYIEQLDVLSNWFIVFVGTLFTAFGIIGFFAFKAYFTRIEKKQKKAEREYLIHVQKIDNIEEKIYTDVIKMNFNTALAATLSNNYPISFFLNIAAVGYFQYLRSASNQVSLENILNNAISDLNDILQFNDINTLEVFKASYSRNDMEKIFEIGLKYDPSTNIALRVVEIKRLLELIEVEINTIASSPTET